MRHQGDTEGSAADDEPTTLMQTVIETMHATGEARGTKAVQRAKGPADDQPSTPTPTVTETTHATGEVRGTKAMPKVGEPTTSRPLSRRR